MSTTPAPSPHTLAVFVGGLGGNQFAVGYGEDNLSLIERAGRLPGVKVLRLDGPGCNGDIVPAIEAAREPTIERVIIVSHSRGWYAAAAACMWGIVDFFIACDPAWADWSVHQWPHPNSVQQPGAFFKATDFGVPMATQLNIQNGPQIQMLDGPSDPLADNHNTCTRNPVFTASVLTLLDSQSCP